MPYLRLLGGAVLEDEAGAVTGPAGRRHPLALLAILATGPACTVSRGKVVGLLWPESPEQTARNRLNTCLHRLRSSLGREVLRSAGDDLRLDFQALPCDVVSFQQALDEREPERAVELYGGPFLDGFALGGSPEFEKWVDRERARLRGRYLEALESLAVAAEARGEPEAAVKWWRERAGQDPYDSRVAARLMQALDSAGNRPAALQAARVHAQLLEQEFGTGPSAEVRDLEAELKTGGASQRSMGRPSRLHPRARSSSAGSSLEAPGLEVPASPPASEAGPDRPTGAPRSREAASARRALWGASVALGLLAAAVAAVWFLLGANGSEGPAADAGSVAVLPFQTLGGEEATPFARGIQLGLLTRLSRLPELAVISEGSVERLARTEDPLRETAARFGVAWIVRGDVQQAGERVQVSVRLVDARRDRQVWAETYRAALSAGDLFEIQGEIVQRIAEALEVRMGPDAARRVTAVPTEHTAAYELYLQAEELIQLPASTPERIDRRIRLYRRALELDPDFAEAWARLAHAYITRAWSGQDPPLWADSALAAARRALELDPESAEAYTQIGNVRGTGGDDLEGALEAYQKALELEPSHGVAANNLVATLVLRGRLADALRWLDRARRLSPDHEAHLRGLIRTNALLGRDVIADAWIADARERPGSGIQVLRGEFDVLLTNRRQPAEARAVLEELTTLAERADEDRTVEIDRRRAALELYEGNWSEARRIYRSIPPDVVSGSMAHVRGLLAEDLGLAYSLLRLGHADEAREIAAEVLRASEEASGGDPIDHYVADRRAVASLLLGDTATALDWLERSVEAGFRDVRILRTVPTLAPLRGHPGFEALLERLDELVAEERRRADEGGWGLPPDWTGSS